MLILINSNLTESFLEALTDSYAELVAHGPRSPEKLKPFHGWFHKRLAAKYPDLTVASLLPGSHELRVEGAYYPKKVDIAVVDDRPAGKGRILYTISLKFVISNLKQNANNYFEHLLGETANLRQAGIPVAAFTVFRNPLPYYSRSGEIQRWETLGDSNLSKYLRLVDDDESSHQPFPIGIEMISIDASNGTVAASNDSQLADISPAIRSRIAQEFGLTTFIEKLTERIDLQLK